MFLAEGRDFVKKIKDVSLLKAFVIMKLVVNETALGENLLKLIPFNFKSVVEVVKPE